MESWRPLAEHKLHSAVGHSEWEPRSTALNLLLFEAAQGKSTQRCTANRSLKLLQTRQSFSKEHTQEDGRLEITNSSAHAHTHSLRVCLVLVSRVPSERTLIPHRCPKWNSSLFYSRYQVPLGKEEPGNPLSLPSLLRPAGWLITDITVFICKGFSFKINPWFMQHTHARVGARTHD